MKMKPALIGALGLLWIFGASGQAQPLAQYTFNDGTPRDISANGLDGVLLGNAAVVADPEHPERGQVLQINQSGMQVDGPFDITTAYTLSVWVKLDQPLSGRDYFAGPLWIRADDQGGSPRHWFEINTTQSPRQFFDKFDSTSTGVSEGILDGQWHHVAFVLEESGEYSVYFDGNALASRDGAVAPHDYGGQVGPLFCGAGDDSGSSGLSGYMDDIRIYNYAVSEAEIPGLMMEGPGTEQAHDPQPEHGATGVLVAGATLSWKTGVDPADANFPNPAITAHFLWLSKAYDTMNPPGSPNWQDPDVKVFTIGADTNPADGNVDPQASQVIAGLQKDSLYFWAVDESLGASGPTDADNLILGSTWSFETEKSGPEVDAGSSIVTWLEAGTTTVDLNGTVTDSTGDVTSIKWSVLSVPFGSAVDIADDSVAATTATLAETGRYVLELHAIDATQQEDSDRIEINVYADSCEAAKNDPNGYSAPVYDFNDDCRVDFKDFAMFAQAWLQDESLTSDALYDAGTIFLPPVVQLTNPLDGSTVSGEVIINAIAYDEAVGTTDGDGMEGAGGVDFEIIDGSGVVLGSHHENLATFDMTWDTTLPVYPNGTYTIRVTAESDAGYETVVEISVTVSNP
ncbi:MAG: Ig-like domain-containing protein [Phycisphaerales bacterium]|jgi:hypothetical protein